LAGSALYVFGPHSFQTTHCCTVRSHVGAWLPLALLGVELALRSGSRWNRAAAIGIGGFGFSQILAGWLGQGSLNAALIIGAYAIARAYAMPNARIGRRSWWKPLVRGGCIALAAGLSGAALNAAALWPRLVVNAETNLSAGRYDDLPLGYYYPPYPFDDLVRGLVADSLSDRRMTVPAAALVLVLSALILTPKSPAVRFFSALTVVILLLSMSMTPVYQVFSVIPFWKVLHDHYPAQITTGIMIGPAILAAASIDAIRTSNSRSRLFLAGLLSAVVIGAAIYWISTEPGVSPGLVVPAIVAGIAITTLWLAMTRPGSRVSRWAAAVFIGLILLEPFGLEVTGSLSRWDPIPGWESQWEPNQSVVAAIDLYAAATDPNGAGAFLQEKMRELGPFRFAGYGGITWPDQRQSNVPYAARRAQPEVAAMLVNGRSIFLHLYDMQGYNPVQLSRYTDYILALNTVPQDYHLANLRPEGIGSPLLDALNVRYILIDARIPPDREDVLAISHGEPPVFETDLVRVYENPTVMPHAWLVHNAIPSTRDEAIARLTDRDLDLTRTALVETTDIRSAPVTDVSADRVTVTLLDPERIEVQVTASANALLVLSEIVESGWTAGIDGRNVEIIPTNIALRGVWVEPGTHSVVFTYRPPSLTYGLLISVVSHALLLVLLAVSAVRRIRARGNIEYSRVSAAPDPV
jgi:hypothetical protein